MEDTPKLTYREIGKGFCGSFWTLPTPVEDQKAIKREDGGPGRFLSKDYQMHKTILQHLQISILGWSPIKTVIA